LAPPELEGKAMLNRCWLATAAGVLFVTFTLWPAHAAIGQGEAPKIDTIHFADFRTQDRYYAGDGETPDTLPWSGDLRIVTVVLTRLSVADRIVEVELFPREIAVRPGDGVLWLSAVPGAVARVVFETTPRAVGNCTAASPLPTRSYVSASIAPGEASLLCFPTSGIFPYRLEIATQESEGALRGVVVVGQ
jgi:hypothetical protein